LAGEGVYYIAGSENVAERFLQIPTRFVNPKLPGNLKLSYVTSLGIVKYIAGMSLGQRDVEILNHEKVNEEITEHSEIGLLNKFINFWKK